MNAKIVQDRACIPCVSENISIVKPHRNEIVNTMFIFIVRGSLTMKYIKTKGTATLNRHILLHMTTCAKINTKNRIVMFNAVLPIIFSYSFDSWESLTLNESNSSFILLTTTLTVLNLVKSVYNFTFNE